MNDLSIQNRSDLLCQTWFYSQEESSSEVMVYYNESHLVRPTRGGRLKIEFKSTGDFAKWVIAPSCGLDEIPGKWNWTPNGNVVIHTFKESEGWRGHSDDVYIPRSGRTGGFQDREEVPIQQPKRQPGVKLVILSLTKQQLRIESKSALLYEM